MAEMEAKEEVKRIAGGFDTIPSDILFQILVRVPVMSVPSAKLVCREWGAVIADKRFVGAHLAHAMTGIPGFLVSFKMSGCHHLPHEYEEAGDRRFIALPQLQYPHHLCCMVSSCRGLICYYDEAAKRFIVANPITAVTLQLPPLPPGERRLEGCCMMFEEVSGGYKVLAWSKITVFLLTVGCETWKTITGVGNPSLKVLLLCQPAYRHGALHWSTPKMKEVLSFDIRSEVFEWWVCTDPKLLSAILYSGPSHVSRSIDPDNSKLTVCFHEHYGSLVSPKEIAVKVA